MGLLNIDNGRWASLVCTGSCLMILTVLDQLPVVCDLRRSYTTFVQTLSSTTRSSPHSVFEQWQRCCKVVWGHLSVASPFLKAEVYLKSCMSCRVVSCHRLTLWLHLLTCTQLGDAGSVYTVLRWKTRENAESNSQSTASHFPPFLPPLHPSPFTPSTPTPEINGVENESASHVPAHWDRQW